MKPYINYDNNALNVITSLLKYFNVPTEHKSLPLLDEILKEKKYQKVILIILDGFGYNLIEKHLKGSYLEKHLLTSVSSVFPSTTTAAMNTYYSGKSPLEHGWLGWSCFMKECNRNINLFPGTDKFDASKVNFPYKDYLKYEDIFSKINKQNEFKTLVIKPKRLASNYDSSYTKSFNSLKGFVKQIKKASESKEKLFTFAYHASPDHEEHLFGLDFLGVKKFLNDFNNLLEKALKNIDEETLVLISADHGLIDIKNTIYLEDYPKLLDTLITMPFIEPRAASFVVKKGREKEFETLAKEIFTDGFDLLTKEEVFELNLLGSGTKHQKIDDFILDYLLISSSHTIFDIYRKKDGFSFKGHHAGISKDETTIPLIMIKK